MKMIMFIPKITSVILKLLFFVVISAMTSIPSKVPPPRMASPIPIPMKKPPNMATNNLSWVSSGKGTKYNIMAISKIVIMLLMAKFLFTLLKAMITKGVLSNISNRPRFQSYSSNSKSEIPVIPPSRKWLELRNFSGKRSRAHA